MADSNRPNLGAELRAMWRQGREDFLNALLRPQADSMPLTREVGAPDTPTAQNVTRDLDGGFQSVLAEYAQRAQTPEKQPDKEMER